MKFWRDHAAGTNLSVHVHPRVADEILEHGPHSLRLIIVRDLLDNQRECVVEGLLVKRRPTFDEETHDMNVPVDSSRDEHLHDVPVHEGVLWAVDVVL